MMQPEKKKRRRGFKWFLKRLMLFVGSVFLVVLILNGIVWSAGRGKIYTSASEVPSRKVALVLGTSPKFEGRKNLYFEGRMRAAALLYKSGKVEKILASGDNKSRYYDEPTAMKKSLMDKGVPESAIVLDYAGLRTLDSVVRAHEIFGLSECVIVTDDFHLPRALFIAQHEGLDAVGFQADVLPMSVSPRTHVREVGSRIMAVLDVYVLKTRPEVLGAPEKI